MRANGKNPVKDGEVIVPQRETLPADLAEQRAGQRAAALDRHPATPRAGLPSGPDRVHRRHPNQRRTHLGTTLVQTAAFLLAKTARRESSIDTRVRFSALDNAPYEVVHG